MLPFECARFHSLCLFASLLTMVCALRDDFVGLAGCVVRSTSTFLTPGVRSVLAEFPPSLPPSLDDLFGFIGSK